MSLFGDNVIAALQQSFPFTTVNTVNLEDSNRFHILTETFFNVHQKQHNGADPFICVKCYKN